jgi:hypothetical protein
MNPPRKRTDAEVWRALEASAETELARIDALSDDELDRELRDAGISPDLAASIVQPPPSVAPPREPAVARPPVAVPPRERLVTPQGTPTWGWVALAAAVALVIATTARRREIALWFGHEPIGPDTAQTPESVLAERAARLRHDALGLCEQGFWYPCEQKLDEARKLNPAGESEPQVQAARLSIDQAAHPPDAGTPREPDKPGR